jgi:hypothetical protein
MKHPSCIYVWTGEGFMPTLHFARLAERSFTSGQAYRMIVATEEEQKKTRRTGEQNSKLWAMLGEIAEQVEHCGHRYSSDQWKVLLMHACGHEVQFLPALDGKTFVPYGGRSSHMTIGQMSELIEFIYSWGVQQGVKFSDQEGITWQR